MAVQAIMHSGMPPEIALLLQYGARRVEQLPAPMLEQIRIEAV
jgi:hypothetical protein